MRRALRRCAPLVALTAAAAFADDDAPPADAIKRWRGSCDILELTLNAPTA